MENPQLCSINIMFPVETDEKAIEIKKKIAAVVGDIENVKVDFRLMVMPTAPPVRRG